MKDINVMVIGADCMFAAKEQKVWNNSSSHL